MIVISNEDKDELKEMLNTGLGHASAVYSDLVEQFIKVRVRNVDILSDSVPCFLDKNYADIHEWIHVEQGFSGDLEGKGHLLFNISEERRFLSACGADDSIVPTESEARDYLSAIASGIIMPCIACIMSHVAKEIDYDDAMWRVIRQPSTTQASTEKLHIFIDAGLITDANDVQSVFILQFEEEQFERFRTLVSEHFKRLTGA